MNSSDAPCMQTINKVMRTPGLSLGLVHPEVIEAAQRSLQRFADSIVDIPPEFAKLINDEFWDLV